MASHTKALLRKWARYGTCGTCGVLAGDPCRRVIPPTWRYRDHATVLNNPHRGRPKSKERCGDTGSRQLRANSTFACCLVPDHGGEWPTQTSTLEVVA